MENDDDNIILKSLSKSLNTEIKYITYAITLNINKRNNKKLVEKTIILLLTKDKIMVILEDFNQVHFSFEYQAIREVILDANRKNSLKIILYKEALAEKYQSKTSFIVFVKERSFFVKTMLCYHSIFFMEKYGNMSELKLVTKALDFVDLKKNKSLLSNGEEINLSKAPGFDLKKHKSGYCFYLKEGYAITEDDDTYIFPNLSVTLTINISQNYSIDLFYTNKDMKDIEHVMTVKVVEYLNANKISPYWFITREFYNKKINITMDKAIWEGFKIEIRGIQMNTKEQASSEEQMNIAFIFLRRKYIPPFYDLYNDILIILKEPVNKTIIKISNEATYLLETVADTLHINEYFLSPDEYHIILDAKVESLLLDEDALKFFYNNLEIKGKRSYLNALNYTYKLLISIERVTKSQRIKEITSSLWIDLVKTNKAFNPNFDEEEHSKRLKHSDIDTFIREFIQIISMSGSSEYFNKMKVLWENKLWRYLSFCINGGLTNNMFTIYDLIKIFTEVNEDSNLCTMIQLQISNLINYRIYNMKGEKLESKITSVINNITEIKSFEYNEIVLNALIRTGTLREIQSIDNNNNLTSFIKFLLEQNPSLNFLESLQYYLKKTIRGNNVEIINSFLIALPALNTIFCDIKKPLNSIESCKILCLVTSNQNDKNNRQRLLSFNILLTIIYYLDYPNETMLYNCLILLKNLINELGSMLQKIDYFDRLFSKLVSLFKGTRIINCFHEIQTIDLLANVLIRLLMINPVPFKELLHSIEMNEDTAFINSILDYIYIRKEKIGNVFNEKMLLKLHVSLFEFFDIYTRKSEERITLINQGGRIEKMLNDISENSIDTIKTIIKPTYTKDMIKKDEVMELKLKKIAAMFTFAFYSITQDISLKISMKKNHNSYFLMVVSMIFEYKNKDTMYLLAKPVASVQQEFNEIDDDI